MGTFWGFFPGDLFLRIYSSTPNQSLRSESFWRHLDSLEVGHSTCAAVFDDDPEVVGGHVFFLVVSLGGVEVEKKLFVE